MHLFRYAGDYYGDALAQQLLVPAAFLFCLFAIFVAGVHALRRSVGQPRSTEQMPPRAFPSEVERYAIGARLYHWGNALSVAVLAVSGYALFVPASLKPTVVTWLRIHELFAIAFAASVFFHVIIAPVRGQGRTMWFERRDWSDIRTMLANFIGRTREYPAFGKYDPLQKVYHAALAVMSGCLIVSGTFLTVSAEVWGTVPRDLLRWMRLLHDLSAASFVAVVAGHIYFGLIRVNWPALGAMVTGRISGAYLALYHSPERWWPQPPTRGSSGD